MRTVASELRRRFGLVADEACNVPLSIVDKVGRELHNQPNHPLGMIKQRVVQSLQRSCERRGRAPFELFDQLAPFVSVRQNFDDLLVPPGHTSRRPSDTYYVSRDTVLRTHTSAHQSELIRAARRAFLVASDVYRRDEIDSSHYPVFHQMEGVRLFAIDSPEVQAAVRAGGGGDGPVVDPTKLDEGEKQTGPITGPLRPQPAHLPAAARFVEDDMKQTVEDMAEDLFGKNVQMRWVDGFFPFTRPSLELEVYFQDRWMEVMGCGVVQQKILASNGAGDYIGWAFGFGLERLALKLFDIPDVRLFWSTDPRFLSQFEAGKRDVRFVPFSKYPHCYKDITFWLPQRAYHDNDFFEVVRDVAGDLVENVQLVDTFTHPKRQRKSRCYRILYRSMDRSLTNDEINELQAQVRQRVESVLGGELR